ncbi:MAG: c-type cytochrome [Gemmatimonadales bacterium]
MTTWRCACFTLLFVGSLGACHERMGKGWDWNRMRSQPKYTTWGKSGFFADGKAMQLPPAGTVSRESAADTADHGAGANDTVLGASRFRIFCALCHGDRGDGVSVVASNMEPPRPPSLLGDSVRRLSPDRIDSIIDHGYGRMPALSPALSAADRRAVITYLRELQRHAATPPAP